VEGVRGNREVPPTSAADAEVGDEAYSAAEPAPVDEVEPPPAEEEVLASAATPTYVDEPETAEPEAVEPEAAEPEAVEPEDRT
jgi:hypothetical protein